MEARRLNIRDYKWMATVYLDVSPRDYEDIVEHLRDLRVSSETMMCAQMKLLHGGYNFGFTATNPRMRETVIVVGRTTCEGEFLNTVQHEVRHLVDDLASACGLDKEGEDVGYLTGDINYYLTEPIQQHICPCGRPAHSGPCRM